ncbi:amidohydrolase [Seongchinamella sediminis]|uniref:Omega-amidase YafV n=1 Tax=Seongchinamella sediminis TaxID=2283635 RepID=A0A3L7E0S3_9GAMM|nr:amidohydrolase [Seongchinamella sediminis]RLQ21993.1 amidohydrolase [Seongchinamella sediminis]
MRDLSVTLVQPELQWEQPAENRKAIGEGLKGLAGKTDLVVLPEMFTTGFSMNALANAELPGGVTEQWLRALASELDCAVTGSIAVKVGDDVYNRMLFATPEALHHYDKRHLFRMAGEHQRYRGGSERVIVEWRDWRILLQVCYDLRFPVFSRNRQDYDLALYIANWPAARRMHWRQLLLARAIENLACVVGINRIGSDAKGLDYTGDSLAVAADGRLLADLEARADVRTVSLSAGELRQYRERFPAHMDADRFSLDR